MNVIKTNIPDVLILEPQIFKDARGCFFESFNAQKYKDAGINTVFVQDNESWSSKGAIRALHLQLTPMSQGKLARAVKGAVQEVAVDCRLGSTTFGKYVSEVLSEENKYQLWIPRGFASGYCALTDDVVFSYKVDNYYSKEHEVCLLYNDPDLGIGWNVENPILSPKDAAGIKFADLRSMLIGCKKNG